MKFTPPSKLEVYAEGYDTEAWTINTIENPNPPVDRETGE